jgi:hypothetical protein
MESRTALLTLADAGLTWTSSQPAAFVGHPQSMISPGFMPELPDDTDLTRSSDLTRAIGC